MKPIYSAHIDIIRPDFGQPVEGLSVTRLRKVISVLWRQPPKRNYTIRLISLCLRYEIVVDSKNCDMRWFSNEI